MSIGKVMKEAGRSTDSLHARRFEGVVRPYPQADAERLRGSIRISYTLAEMGAKRLWELLHTEDYVNALGALTGNQAVQIVRAGLNAIYLSGWQVAADVCEVPTLLVARTDADSAKLLLSDVDPRDREFIVPGDRTPEGFFRMKGGLECAIARGLAYAPYTDLLWCETSHPDLAEARAFAEGIRAKFPNKLLAYNCSPSFNWKKHLDDATIAKFQRELGAMGYKFQFVTLAGFHALNFSMFNLARDYAKDGMTAYSRMQQAEFAAESTGYTATKHQREVGTGYFDEVAQVIAGGAASTLALNESTENEQFYETAKASVRVA